MITAIIGGTIGYYLLSYIGGSMVYLLPFAAGGFIYIAASNLIPELRKEVDSRESMAPFGIFLFGFAFVFLVKLYFSHRGNDAWKTIEVHGKENKNIS